MHEMEPEVDPRKAECEQAGWGEVVQAGKPAESWVATGAGSCPPPLTWSCPLASMLPG